MLRRDAFLAIDDLDTTENIRQSADIWLEHGQTHRAWETRPDRSIQKRSRTAIEDRVDCRAMRQVHPVDRACKMGLGVDNKFENTDNDILRNVQRTIPLGNHSIRSVESVREYVFTNGGVQ